MGEAFSIYSGFFLQRLRNRGGGRRWGNYYGGRFCAFLHAAGRGAFLGHVAGFGSAFLGLLLVFALVGSGGSNESKQGEGEQSVFHIRGRSKK